MKASGAAAIITPTLLEILGHPARSLKQWIDENKFAFMEPVKVGVWGVWVCAAGLYCCRRCGDEGPLAMGFALIER